MGQTDWQGWRVRLRRLAQALAVLAVALGAGQLVQTVAAEKAPRPSLAALKLPVHIVQLSAAADDRGLVAPLLARPLADPGRSPAGLTAPAADAAPAGLTDCRPALTLSTAPGAMLVLDLSAPCDAGARVEVAHAGMEVSARVDADGLLQMTLPALEAAGRVAVRFGDGREAVAARPVDLTGLRRFALAWQGRDGILLHGFARGAEFGAAGDVSPAAPGAPGPDGWLVTLGDAGVAAPLRAQVYTYPQGAAPVEIAAEAAVTQASCGQELHGQTIDSADGVAQANALDLTMPDCSAAGGFLVLKNLAQDVKLAQR